MKRSISFLLATFLVVTTLLTACSTNGDTVITASGTLSVVEVPVAPEVSGRVVSISVNEGDAVKAGDELFRLDDELLQTQYNQGAAAVDAAAATLAAGQAQIVYAQRQHELALQAARAQEDPFRVAFWTAATPDDFQPAWYFQVNEKLDAAVAEVDAAEKDLADEAQNLADEISKASNQDFIAAENRLAEAQAAYTVAQKTLTQAKSANDKTLTDAAQEIFDRADTELSSARLEYDRMLTSSSADAVLRARARVTVAQARLDNARVSLSALQTGDHSIQVSVAEAGVDQAQAAVSQAQANLNQAEASLALLKLQLERAVVTAPVDGTLLTRDLEVGQLVAAGGIIMTFGQLETMDLTVYIPIDRYGQVSIGQKVEISVDSFDGVTFPGHVVKIADSAEFTPRNVQSAEGRASTVYAVKISVANTDLRLKPGMPADVKFIP
ncbi:MAG: HlyD family efflux transporter periplasmic adaptor subunit [Chloroflexi bacterium]|nr:HlyD family efflux transporter periplasmic adaptor subunit [Chloroflexota bacterium]